MPDVCNRTSFCHHKATLQMKGDKDGCSSSICFFFHNLVVYIHGEVCIFFLLVQMTTFSRFKMTEGFSECHLPISPKEPSLQC